MMLHVGILASFTFCVSSLQFSVHKDVRGDRLRVTRTCSNVVTGECDRVMAVLFIDSPLMMLESFCRSFVVSREELLS